jgi:hypothetical protein
VRAGSIHAGDQRGPGRDGPRPSRIYTEPLGVHWVLTRGIASAATPAPHPPAGEPGIATIEFARRDLAPDGGTTTQASSSSPTPATRRPLSRAPSTTTPTRSNPQRTAVLPSGRIVADRYGTTSGPVIGCNPRAERNPQAHAPLSHQFVCRLAAARARDARLRSPTTICTRRLVGSGHRALPSIGGTGRCGSRGPGQRTSSGRATVPGPAGRCWAVPPRSPWRREHGHHGSRARWSEGA